MKVGDIVRVNLDGGWIGPTGTFAVIEDITNNKVTMNVLKTDTESTSPFGRYRGYHEYKRTPIEGKTVGQLIFGKLVNGIIVPDPSERVNNQKVETIVEWDGKPITWVVDTTD